MNITRHPQSGFTLIELMIVIAAIAVLLSLAIPVYQDYAIRTRVAEGLSVAAAAKLAVTETCQTSAGGLVSSNADAGYSFSPSTHFADIQVQANCAAGIMVVYIETQNTGAAFDPVILLTTNTLFVPVQLSNESRASSIGWSCWGYAASPAHLPSECRSSAIRFHGDQGTA